MILKQIRIAKKTEKVYKRLRLTTNEPLIKRLRDQALRTKLSSQSKSRIVFVSNKFLPCAKYAKLPRTPKLTLPPTPTPIMAVILNVIDYSNQNLQLGILVRLDT